MFIPAFAILYKYNIPCASDSRKYHNEECDYQPEAQPRLIILFRGMIFSTVTLAGNVIFILLYRTLLDPLFPEVLLLLNIPIMVRGDPKGNIEQPLIYMLE